MSATATHTVGFYLVPGFPLLAFASAIEPLRAANRLTGEPLFAWQIISRDGKPVRASNGIDVAASRSIAGDAAVDLLLICAGTSDAGANDRPLARWLRSQSRRGVALGGISLGPYALAQAGLLDGRRCALHWENLAAFGEQFLRIRTTTELFVVADNRYTCSGGTAALDMMLHVIAARHGRALANDVSEQFIHLRIRSAHEEQRMAIRSRLGVANDKLIAAVEMMENAQDEPRPVRAIAAAVELSPRQLERLFAKYLRTNPQRYYRDLRLERARLLLAQTTRPVLEIAVACGFATASHFSRCYREVYGCMPSRNRGREHENDRDRSR